MSPAPIPARTAAGEGKASVLYPLNLVCPRCAKAHFDTPGNFGRCRRCDFPLREGEKDFASARLAIATTSTPS